MVLFRGRQEFVKCISASRCRGHREALGSESMITTGQNPKAPVEGVVQLADGRSLAWQNSGPPQAPAVLWLHGSTGSRRTAPQANGVRVIAYDRPGYGTSSPHPERTLASDAD